MSDSDLQVEPGDNQVERPEWLPENFKDETAFAESYKELQRTLTTRAQREKELEQQVGHYESLLAAQQNTATPTTQYDPNADPLIVAYETAMENGDYRTALAIQAQVGQAAAQNVVQQALPQVQQQYAQSAEAQAALVADHAWNNLKGRYGDDLEQNRDKIAEVIQAQPWLIPDAAQRDPAVATSAIENVYKIVNPGAFVQGQPVDMTAAKLAAQGLPGAAGRPPSPDAQKAEWDAIRKAAQNDPGRYW